MDKEVEIYLETISKVLNGQIRGAINKKAREENLELIQMTLLNIWNGAVESTLNTIDDIELLDKVRKELIDDTTKPDT